MKIYLKKIKDRIVQGGEITRQEALELMNVDATKKEEIECIFETANAIREKFMGKKVDLCTIMNAKSGQCTEDCKYCAQSVHYETGIQKYPLLEYNQILQRALEMEKQGAHRFSLVTSGRSIGEKDFERLLEIYTKLHRDTDLILCASHGIIGYEQAISLKQAGVSLYHHNVETSRNFYRKICTTHTYQDRIDTIKAVQKAGMTVCCGGIIGMGESIEDRVEMAFEIKDLGVRSIPLNILNPVPGTPLEHIQRLSPIEVLKIMAIYRLIVPEGYIRYAGGRMLLQSMQNIGFRAGVNAALVGNYLTTIGSNIIEDIRMIEQEGLEV